jgi:hypothetical protein
MSISEATDKTPEGLAKRLLAEFVQRTGVGQERSQRRYLWTDAFAVGAFVELHRREVARGGSGQEPLDRAYPLVHGVHGTLGRHHPEDRRSGWISGLDEATGWDHPTRAGLRIGKPKPERGPGERFDERDEWDRDGQYFHYLTKWMHALDVLSRATGDVRLSSWAVELAEAAHRSFVYEVGAGQHRMHWKMSVDGSRPLVAAMGQHDPVDGLVTYRQLEEGAQRSGVGGMGLGGTGLASHARTFEGMVEELQYATGDPLGIGGLLMDAARVAQLEALHVVFPPGFLARLVEGAERGLDAFGRSGSVQQSAARRLAFRELGLPIGLDAALVFLEGSDAGSLAGARSEVADRVVGLRRHGPLARDIRAFWCEPEHRRAATYRENCDINDVMLACALLTGSSVRLG